MDTVVPTHAEGWKFVEIFKMTLYKARILLFIKKMKTTKQKMVQTHIFFSKKKLLEKHTEKDTHKKG